MIKIVTQAFLFVLKHKIGTSEIIVQVKWTYLFRLESNPIQSGLVSRKVCLAQQRINKLKKKKKCESVH